MLLEEGMSLIFSFQIKWLFAHIQFATSNEKQISKQYVYRQNMYVEFL